MASYHLSVKTIKRSAGRSATAAAAYRSASVIIARRLDTLGAITRGQRQTGGQGLFRPEDNLESPYARDALRQLYRRIYRGDVAGCSLGAGPRRPPDDRHVDFH